MSRPREYPLAPVADWGIWCRVSGGVTGTREGWMKREGVRWYGTEEEATALAEETQDQAGSPFSTASFHCEARRIF